MSGHPLTRYDATPAKCYPSKPGAECCRCGRFVPGEAPGGKVVAIDAASLPAQRFCPMWLRRVN